MKNPKKLLLFDIDGTLIHSGGAGSRALDRSFKTQCNLSNISSQIRLDGMTDRAIVRSLINHNQNKIKLDGKKNIENLIDKILNLYLSFLKEEVKNSPNYKILPGISKTVSFFSNHPDVYLGLATGNIKKGAEIKLSKGNLFHYFSFGGFGCDAEIRSEIVRKAINRGKEMASYHFSNDDVFVIGDTHHDIQAGQELGVKTVAVATGSYSQEALAKYKPNFLFSEFSNDNNFYQFIFH